MLTLVIYTQNDVLPELLSAVEAVPLIKLVSPATQEAGWAVKTEAAYTDDLH